MPTEPRPNLFIVGAQRSGTSALTGWLRQHPQVFMSFPKEPGFLAFGARGYPFTDGYGNAAPASQYVVTDERVYRGLFAQATPVQTIIGEASTWYLAIPGTAHRIKTYNAMAKIIAVLRNPAERAYSAWCNARRDRLEPCESFATALAMEAQRGEVEFLLRYRRMGLYSQAITEYQGAFPAAQLLILLYEDLYSDPLTVWHRVCEFLGVSCAEIPVFSQKYNRSGRPRWQLLQTLLQSHRFKLLMRSILPDQIGMQLKERINDFNMQQFPAMDEAIRAELRTYYLQDVQRLSHLIDRELLDWLQ